MEKMTYENVIASAIEKEEEAAAFYEELSGRVKRVNVKQMFKEFAAEEMKHKEKLEGVAPESISSSSVESVPDLKISDYLVDVEFKPDMGYQEVLIVAMKREENAHNLYISMAKEFSGSQLEKLFQLLAQEEAKHKLRLEEEYDEKVLTEF